MSGGLAFWSIKCIVITKVIDVNRFSFSDQNDLTLIFLKVKITQFSCEEIGVRVRNFQVYWQLENYLG